MLGKIYIEKTDNGEVLIYPDDISSIDTPFSYDPENPVYRSFSPDGDDIVYASFVLKGSIIESFERKYGTRISEKLIRNIQELVYFLNDYKIRFYQYDKLAFFYSVSDERILYLSFKSVLKKSISEVYLFNTIHGDRYLNFDNSYLQPCITNGPFNDCPDVRFLNENGVIVPVFDVKIRDSVRLPFLAKMIETGQTRRSGGEAEFIYSNYATKAVFKGFGSINNLRKNALYKKGAVIGKSGFILEDGKNGIVYYLRKKDNNPVSPFAFHHTEKILLEDKYQTNFQIVRNFYFWQLQNAKKFEKKYY